MYKTFLIKYAEIAIKGKNRYIFEDALVKNIKYQLRNVDGSFEVSMRMRALTSSVKQLSSISTMYTRIRALPSR